MKGLCIDQFFTYKFLSNLRWSPDGKRAAFTVTVANKDENAYDAFLYLYENGTVKQLTALGAEKGAFWEDDTHLMFPAVRTKDEKKRAEAGEFFTSYYRLDVTGGEALPAFELPVQAGELHALENGACWFTAHINSRTPDAYLDDEDAREAARDEKKANEDYIILEETPFYFNGDTFHNHRRNALFVRCANGSVKRLTAPLMDVADAACVNGKLYFVGREYDGFGGRRNGLFTVDPATGETTELVPQDAGYFSRIKAYKGGLLLAFTEGKTYEYGEVPFFYFYNVDTNECSLLCENKLELGSSAGSDCRFGAGINFKVVGDDVYFTATVRDRSNLYKLTANGAEAVVDALGSVDCFDVNEAGEILMIGLQNGKLQELYTPEAGAWKQLSCFNEDQYTDRYVSDYDHITVDSEGYTIDGWILKPIDFDPDKTYPAILDIHGGPRTIFSAVFFHEMQYWAGQGYFVFFCNPTGSDGQGDEFADITGEYGVHDYANIMDFTDAVLARYPQIDKARLGVTGGSYGGFMTNWIIGHTDRFAAAATQRSISNWTSFYGTSDIGPWFGGYQNKATYTQNHDRMWKQSPIAYADNFKTPTLIIHSDCDYRCPVSEGYQLLTALQERGVPARMVIFKGENHELSRGGKPLHRLRRLKEISDWMDKYCK